MPVGWSIGRRRPGSRSGPGTRWWRSAQGGITIAEANGVAELHARRGILATGVRESSRHARLISGDRPLGVITTGTLQAMVHLHHMAPFSRPVVVGTELVSLSALLTCRKAKIGRWR